MYWFCNVISINEPGSHSEVKFIAFPTKDDLSWRSHSPSSMAPHWLSFSLATHHAGRMDSLLALSRKHSALCWDLSEHLLVGQWHTPDPLSYAMFYKTHPFWLLPLFTVLFTSGGIHLSLLPQPLFKWLLSRFCQGTNHVSPIFLQVTGS